jgi:outer membrane immunogenic protein
VFRLEAQGDWADLRGSSVSKSIFLASPGDVSNWSKIDAFGLFTGQVGYSLNNALLYIKGGAAVTRDAYEAFGTFTNGIGATTTENRRGGAVGVGLEFAFAPSWSSVSNTITCSWAAGP